MRVLAHAVMHNLHTWSSLPPFFCKMTKKKKTKTKTKHLHIINDKKTRCFIVGVNGETVVFLCGDK